MTLFRKPPPERYIHNFPRQAGLDPLRPAWQRWVLRVAPWSRDLVDRLTGPSWSSRILAAAAQSDGPRSPQRFPLNVEGPFYTCGNCLSCGLPESEAPDLLAPLDDGNNRTYFRRQPQTPDELERACQAIRVCCLADLRYGGKDPAIIQRLGNDSLVCDFILRDGQVVPGDRDD